MAALQFVQEPGYAALLLRKSYADLLKPEGLIPRSMEWLGGLAKWHGASYTWEFPSGATLSFGYLDNETDRFRYQSSAYQFLGFDELTHFSEGNYRYLFSRLRRLKDNPLPLRMRSGSNPGGVGHEWVKRRFLTEGMVKRRWYVPSRLADNPSLDRDEYIKTLGELDPITLMQLLNGDWSARNVGSMFKRENFGVVDHEPERCRYARFWDMAATKKKEGQSQRDPDWTAGCLMALSPQGQWYICNMVRRQSNPKETEDLILVTAKTDPLATKIGMEQEPGASGVITIDHYARNVLVGFDFTGVKSGEDKVARANPLCAAALRGNVFLVRGSWNGDFLDELEGFPEGAHDDQVDSTASSMALLHSGTATGQSTVIQSQPRDRDVGIEKMRGGRALWF